MRKLDLAKHDEKRRHILKAAEECFLRDGFRGASIGDICAAAQMSPGHLYHYFASKEAIIEALFELRLERSAAVVGQLTPDEDLVTALHGWLDRRIREIRAASSSLGLEMMAESARNPAIAKISSRADRGVRELLSRLIHDGQERGQVDPALDPDNAAVIVHCIIFGLNRLGAIRDPGFDVTSASAMLKLLLERFLKPQAATSRRHPRREAKKISTARRRPAR